MKILTPLLFLLFGASVQAQDPLFSQFYNNRVYLNPAFTGIYQCFTLRLHHRSQWQQVPGGFETQSATVEIAFPVLRTAIAPFVLRDVEGQGSLTTTIVGGNLSHFVSFDDEKSLHLGLSANWIRKSADWSRFVFSDQLDPVNGVVQPTAAPQIEPRSGVDIGGGIAWRSGYEIQKKEAFYNLGFSLHHFTNPEDALTGAGRATGTRWSLHGGTTMPFLVDYLGSNRFYLYVSPQFRVERQQEVRHISIGSYVMYAGVYLGGFRQFTNHPFGNEHTDAMMFSLGYEIPYGAKKESRLRVEGSYNVNSSGLSTRSGGVFEISLTWMDCGLLKGEIKGRRRPSHSYKCPKLTGFMPINFF